MAASRIQISALIMYTLDLHRICTIESLKCETMEKQSMISEPSNFAKEWYWKVSKVFARMQYFSVPFLEHNQMDNVRSCLVIVPKAQTLCIKRAQPVQYRTLCVFHWQSRTPWHNKHSFKHIRNSSTTTRTVHGWTDPLCAPLWKLG